MTDFNRDTPPPDTAGGRKMGPKRGYQTLPKKNQEARAPQKTQENKQSDSMSKNLGISHSQAPKQRITKKVNIIHTNKLYQLDQLNRNLMF